MNVELPVLGTVSGPKPTGAPRLETDRPGHRVSTLKNAIATCLVALVLFTAIPAGGTPPLVWVVVAMAVGGLGICAAMGLPTARKPASHGILALLLVGLAVCGFAVVQAGLAHVPLAPRPIILPDRTLMLRVGSLSPDATLIATLRVASALGFWWLMVSVSGRPERAQRIAQALFAGIVAQSVWALMLLASDRASAYPGSAVGSFVGRNALATHLGMGLVLGLALIRRGRPSLVLWLGLAAIAVALFSTQSRLGLAAAGVAALVVVALRRPDWRTGLTLAFAAIASAGLLGQGVAERAVWLAPARDARVELYAQVWQMIAARPLTGFGLDSFPLAFEIFHRPPVPTEPVWDRAHSTYLTLWAESGLLVGSLPPLAGVLALAMLLRRRDNPMAVAAIAALVLAGLHSLADFSLEIPANLFLLLALVGLGLGAGRPAKG